MTEAVDPVALTQDEARAFLATLAVEGDDRRLADGDDEPSRRASFGQGWGDRDHRVYKAATLTRLTWRNLGYRARRAFARRTPDDVFEVFQAVYEIDGPLATTEGRASISLNRLLVSRRPVFILYSGRDREVAVRLHAALGAAGFVPWCAAVDLVPGQAWDEAIPAAIEHAAVVLVLITRHWPEVGRGGAGFYGPEDIALAIEHSRREGSISTVVPVRLDGTDARRVPYGLRRKVDIEASSGDFSPVIDGVWRVLGLAVSETEMTTPISLAAAPVPPEPQPDRRPVLEPVRDQLLAGRWRLVEPVGRGAIAAVWKARDQATHETVAVKILHESFDGNDKGRDRFARGVRQMARLRHPAVVRIIEPVADDGGLGFFVMEWLAGGDLRAAVSSQRLDAMQALMHLCTAADALATAHAFGVVHRDVKPTSLLFDGAGRVRVTDFDLSGASDSAEIARREALGAWVYAAPELMEDASLSSAACDVYGLGMSAVFALLGRALPRQVLRDPGAVIASVEMPPAVRREVLRAVEWQPERRHASAMEFAEALRSALRVAPRVAREVAREAAREVAREVPRGPADDTDTLGDTLPTAGTVMAEATCHRPALVYIPPGDFMMGSPDDEEGRRSNEGPQRRVRLNHGFWMASTLVTTGQFWHTRTGEDAPTPLQPLPISHVTWEIAVAYCNDLSDREGLHRVYVDGVRRKANGYRLPTEAEWEYACRAGSTTRFWSGSDEADLARVGWYRANSQRGLHPVAALPANPWGLYDMHGNCREWCHDWYGNDGSDSTQDPTGPLSGHSRVLRGGSCWSTARGARSAFRGAAQPHASSGSIGFRVVRSVR